MDRALAEKLVERLVQLDAPLNAAAQLIESIEDPNLQRQMKGTIANLVLSVYTELIRPIVREYPDLDPKDGRSD